MDHPHINIVVAYSKTHAIGKDNKLLWHLADDMAFFKKLTTDGVVIMGRKTYESLPSKFRPLPNRINIVLSSQNGLEKKDNLIWAKDLKEILGMIETLKNKEIFVIGGGKIYDLFIPYSKTIYATEVETEIEGDTFFSRLNKHDWDSETMESHSQNEKNDYNFKILKFTRKTL